MLVTVYNRSMAFEARKFQIYIQTKFAEWRGTTLASLTDFSDFVGVSPQVMSNWYSGKLKRRPDPEMYSLLANKFGIEEVYSVLDLPLPEPGPLESAPPALRSLLESALAEIASTLSERSIPVNSPEAEKIAAEILERHGFTISAKDNPG